MGGHKCCCSVGSCTGDCADLNPISLTVGDLEYTINPHSTTPCLFLAYGCYKKTPVKTNDWVENRGFAFFFSDAISNTYSAPARSCRAEGYDPPANSADCCPEETSEIHQSQSYYSIRRARWVQEAGSWDFRISTGTTAGTFKVTAEWSFCMGKYFGASWGVNSRWRLVYLTNGTAAYWDDNIPATVCGSLGSVSYGSWTEVTAGTLPEPQLPEKTCQSAPGLFCEEGFWWDHGAVVTNPTTLPLTLVSAPVLYGCNGSSTYLNYICDSGPSDGYILSAGTYQLDCSGSALFTPLVCQFGEGADETLVFSQICRGPYEYESEDIPCDEFGGDVLLKRIPYSTILGELETETKCGQTMEMTYPTVPNEITINITMG